ncbi:MAG TPA: dihydrolipoamide acetyltransferase family protein [Tepidisphaeraceae bacterium]|jgi:pyruvate dehydrogenase E2 component (dihydrolipoamide acetyltransferase)|nr:dihydrolipoamide acetyltransferase family protein [Tepidisphaeraceae bacterium]
MSADITMPQLSDTMTEGTLVKWLKKEGEKVSAGDKIAEVETDKAVMEMESFDAGVMAALVVAEGQKALVGSLLAVIATGSENPADVKKKIAGRASAPPAAPQPASRQEVAASRKPAAVPAAPSAHFAGATRGEMREPDDVGHGATRHTAVAVPPLHQGNGGDRLHVSPLARRIAEDKNIDLHALRGSGPGGRIVKADVLSYGSSAASPPIASTPQLGSGQTQVIPLTKMRTAIAKSLLASKQNIPHFYESIDVDVEDLTQLRAELNDLLEPEKIRLSLGDFISKAVATALLRHPALNATFNGTEITRYGDVHLGMAVSIPDGLIVPVLRNIHLMGLKEIRQRSVDLVDRARAQRLKQEEMTGGTFTVSNLGTYGIREFSAIINPPQVAILAVAAAAKRAVVFNDQIVARTMITLTLSADHRVVDGAVAANFLKTLKASLEQPGLMLL